MHKCSVTAILVLLIINQKLFVSLVLAMYNYLGVENKSKLFVQNVQKWKIKFNYLQKYSNYYNHNSVFPVLVIYWLCSQRKLYKLTQKSHKISLNMLMRGRMRPSQHRWLALIDKTQKHFTVAHCPLYRSSHSHRKTSTCRLFDTSYLHMIFKKSHTPESMVKFVPVLVALHPHLK